MPTMTAYDGVNQGAGLFERPDRGLLELRGADRASYLQGLLSNDIVALEPGMGCYATYLTPQGRMIIDLGILALGDRLLGDLPGASADAVCAKWSRLVFSEDVQIDVVRGWSSLGLHGPASGVLLATVLTGVGVDELDRLREYHHVQVDLDRGPVVAASSRDTGHPGFMLYGTDDAIASLRDTLGERGAVPASRDIAEVLRIEAGRPAFGVDMDEQTIPLEAGIEDRAISLTKGCYVGQEVIIRVLHRGHGRVARRLVGVTLDGAPDPGDVLTVDDTEVGTLTSVAVSPRFGDIALGYVKRDHVEPGTTLDVRHGDSRLQGRVSRLPFGA